MTAVLAAYLRAPRDAPRELAALILRVDGFEDAVRRASRRRPVRIAQLSPTTTVSRVSDERRPRVDTVVDLARLVGTDVGHLDWFADTKLWNRRAPAGPLHHYRYEWRQRPGRVPRLLEVPGLRLREIQRTVLDELLAPLPLHDAAHGFVAGAPAAERPSTPAGRS